MKLNSCRTMCDYHSWCPCDCGTPFTTDEVCEARLGIYVETERDAYREAFMEYMEQYHIEDNEDWFMGF